jgi:hypothetical protein
VLAEHSGKISKLHSIQIILLSWASEFHADTDLWLADSKLNLSYSTL